jgi:hypothetical protein
MRYTLVLAAAALLAPAPAVAAPAEPPITFQTQPLDRLLNDLRAAAEMVGGEKAVKELNKSIKDKLGDKGFEGLDLNKPVVGYVLLAPKADDIVLVVAFPVTGEKEFLGLCERMNGQKPKDLGQGLYEVPTPGPGAGKARMRFADEYAYVAAGKNPEPALEAKALVPANKLHDPAETAALAGKLHFDRLTPEVKAALVTLLLDAKKELLEKAAGDLPNQAGVKQAFAEVEKLVKRYFLLLGGADTAALRVSLDPGTGDATVEATLTPKPNTELAKQIAARQPARNQFAGLLTRDTVAGAYYSAPLFAEEMRNAFEAVSGREQVGIFPGIPEAGKDTVDELFKGQTRTLKGGEFDFLMAVRGPDKNGHYGAVAAMSFDDPAALEKAFKKWMENNGPPEALGSFKWNADKAGTVNVHTFKLAGAPVPELNKLFGDDLTLAFAFAPKAIYVTLGPDAVGALKDALKAKPAEAPALDVLVNPAKLAKLVETAGGNALAVERAIGREDKLLSATSLRVTSGKELSLRFAINMKLIPRAIASVGFGAAKAD